MNDELLDTGNHMGIPYELWRKDGRRCIVVPKELLENPPYGVSFEGFDDIGEREAQDVLYDAVEGMFE